MSGVVATPGIAVVRAGLFDTVQDRGRFGYQALGFPPGGTQDRRSAAVANILVGNPSDAAVLEYALVGPRLRFGRPAVICLAGASFDARLDGEPLGAYRAVAVPSGAVLDCGSSDWGVYGYLAVAGGIAVPAVLGSRSTSVSCGVGGVEGRALRAGDVLPLAPDAPVALPGIEARRLDSCDAYFRRNGGSGRPVPIRVVPAAEAALPAAWLHRFWTEPFCVTARSDRMGVRLAPRSGRAAALPAAVLPSEGVALGTVQVPAGGEPIVVTADHQTTGGYAKAGTVAGVDLPRLVQCRPGTAVRFEEIALGAAQDLLRAEAAYLRGLERAVERAARRVGQ